MRQGKDKEIFTKKKNMVLIIQRIFTHYRKPIFDKLYKNVNFILLHTSLKTSIQQTKTEYSKKIRYFKYGNSDTNVFLNPFWQIIKIRPKILIHEFSIGILSLIPTLMVAKILGAKIILWGHGYNRKKGFSPDNRIADKIRLILMQKADALLLYGEAGKEELSKYLDRKKLFVAQNTLDTEKLITFKNSLKKLSKDQIKQELKFDKKYNLIYIGRLIKSKKPEYCIKIIKDYINEIGDEIMFHFVGAGEAKEEMENLVLNNKLQDNVKFYGAIYDERVSGKLLYCSDLMIMPGYLGLSVNHAFCFDCPVVSLKQKEDGPFHSPEVEYIIQNKTGYLADSYNDMKYFVFDYLNNKEKQIKFKKEIEYCIENICSVDNMLNGFYRSIKYCKDL